MTHYSRLPHLLFVISFTSVAAAGTTWHVDDDNCPEPGNGSAGDPFCSIQDAIDASADGDEIVVGPGTYDGSINLLGKAITLRSADGPRVTVVRGGSPVISCVNGEGPDSVLEGLTIAAGAPEWGGMLNIGSNPTVSNCIIATNERGSGMRNFCANPTVTNCLFVGNSTFISCSGNGPRGGGMYNVDSSPLVTNCVFAANVVLGEDCCPDCSSAGLFGGAAGMYNEGGAPLVSNCVFWENDIGEDGSLTTVRYSNVSGGWTGLGSNNIDADPLFALGPSGTFTDYHYDAESGLATIIDEGASFEPGGLVGRFVGPFIYFIAEDGPSQRLIVDNTDTAITLLGSGNSAPENQSYQVYEYHLLTGSPCIDAGHNNAIAGLAHTDLDGNPRFADDPATADTGCGLPVVVDMGAYEFQGQPATVVFGDINGDGSVRIMDLIALNQCLGSADPACCVADLDVDGEVGMSDVMLLIHMLVQSAPVGP